MSDERGYYIWDPIIKEVAYLMDEDNSFDLFRKVFFGDVRYIQRIFSRWYHFENEDLYSVKEALYRLINFFEAYDGGKFTTLKFPFGLSFDEVRMNLGFSYRMAQRTLLNSDTKPKTRKSI